MSEKEALLPRKSVFLQAMLP